MSRSGVGEWTRSSFTRVGEVSPYERNWAPAMRSCSCTWGDSLLKSVPSTSSRRFGWQPRLCPPDGVTFLGFLDRQTRLPDLYASCDAFVFASVTETLGLVVLEAIASGLPVIAAPAGGVRDHLRNDENGLTFREGDVAGMARAMVALASDPELTRRLAQGARLTAEALTWKREMDRLDLS